MLDCFYHRILNLFYNHCMHGSRGGTGGQDPHLENYKCLYFSLEILVQTPPEAIVQLLCEEVRMTLYEIR